ncbi:MAG TPA: hypothetical protein VMY77_11710, partial [Chitinophagaceae bacterium]|nr:hypothetical protein [Chitinophagaceae bacterium]
MINTLPEFESRQVLTSDELNWLTCYLDTQGRQSRRFLTGCGLVGGLQVQLNNNTVQITNGIGVTSAGHIVLLSNNSSEFTAYTKIKKYVQHDKEKLAFHYLADIDVTQDDYSKSVDTASLYFPIFQHDVFELVEDTVNDADLINGATIKDKVALLFAEIIQKELKDCEDDNCQERGKKYLYNTRVLVISKEDALLLLKEEYNIDTNNEESISKLAFPWLHLPDINILKPSFSNFPLTSAFNEDLINKEYLRCIKDFATIIGNNKDIIDKSLTDLKNYCTSSNSGFSIVQSLLDQLNKSKVLTGKIPGAILYQLMYDYLWCFVKAYKELQVIAQELKAKCFTNETGFPNHILLGIINNENPDFNSAQPGNYSIYRHNFQSRFVQSEQAAVSKKIALFLKRLQLLVAGLDEKVFTAINEIKITAGASLYGPLSWQAIPYYLHTGIAVSWNQWSGQSRLSTYNTNYYSTNESQVASVKLSYNSLPSGFQGNHTFLRIEGIHGQVALTALNSVYQLRKKHGLPFEVLMLRLNEKAPFSNSFNFTINEDIESMYQVVRAEVLKQIDFNLNYLGGLQLDNAKFNTIQDALIKELEKSYMFFLKNINVTLLSTPIVELLPEAILASNITMNYRSAHIVADAKFNELEAKVSETKPVSNSFMKKEALGVTSMKKNFVNTDVFQPVMTIPPWLFFLNTLGILVSNIKNDNKFKSTTEISFYTHLLAVVKGMQKGSKTDKMFLLSLQLYCGLKLQDEYLTDNFSELDIQKYKNNLDNELLPACDALISFLKKNIDFSDTIILEIAAEEMLDYVNRIRFDDDWVKIIQLDTENKKRNGGLGVENMLERFVKLHPGLSHGCGVPTGGTYIMVYDISNQVVADFYLPYIISSHLRPIQYTLLENKIITLSGNIKDESGKPVEALLLIGNTTTATDKEGFYNVLVNENSKIKLVVKAAGFENSEKEITTTNVSLTMDIVVKKAEQVSKTTTLNFSDKTGKPIRKDIKLLNLTKNIPLTANNGVIKITDAPNTSIKFSVQDESFEIKEFEILIGNNDAEETITLIETAFIRIQIKTDSAYNPALLKDIRVLDPVMELDTSEINKGVFITK